MKNFISQLFIIVALCLFFSSAGSAQNTTNFGDQSGGSSNPNYSGIHNSFFGFKAGTNNTTGNGNTFIGSDAGRENTVGIYNTFIGWATGRGNTTGNNNTFVGNHSGIKNTTGSFNVFVGRISGNDNSTGTSNTFIGQNSGATNTKGDNNTFIGKNAGVANTEGDRNTYLGVNAGAADTLSSDNVCIGFEAGFYEAGNNKLHIANTDSKSLIYGKFDTDQVAIGTTDNYIPNGFTLAVGGKMITEEVKVRLRTNWPDYVFEEDYNKPTLEELEASISENGHLPNIPSAEQVATEGYMLGEMDVKLLEKIEELTLYVIELNKGYKGLQAENESLKTKVHSLILSNNNVLNCK